MEIEDRFSIPRADQSLVLKTAADDGMLLEDDEASLRALGIRAGSELLLSVLAASSTGPEMSTPAAKRQRAAVGRVKSEPFEYDEPSPLQSVRGPGLFQQRTNTERVDQD